METNGVDKKPDRTKMSGEDKVIVACVFMLASITATALIAVVLVPSATVTIVPIVSGTVIAITTLAARHPPVAAVAPTADVAAVAPTAPTAKVASSTSTQREPSPAPAAVTAGPPEP